MKEPVLLNRTLVKNRALALIDIENLAGTPNLSSQLVTTIKGAFCSIALMNSMSQTYIGCNPEIQAEVCFGWHDKYTLCTKPGKDGADLALIEEIRNIKNLEDYNTIIIGSGDHIFTDIAQDLRNQGHYIHVIVGKGKTSWQLRSAAHKVSQLSHMLAA